MRYFLTLLFSLCLSLSVVGQDWKPLQAMALEQAEQLEAYDAVTLLDSVSVVVSEAGSGTFTIRKVIMINSDAGALANRVIKYDYDPLTAFAEFGEVTIYRGNGNVEHVDLSKACDYVAPASMIYWGARQIMIGLESLRKGDVVDYRIDKKGFTYALLAAEENDRFTPPMVGEFFDIVPFWTSNPTMRKIYRMALPKDKPLQHQFYQGVATTSLRLEGDTQVLTCVVENTRPFVREPNQLDLFDEAPKLMLSTTPTWMDKSRWFYGVNEAYGSFLPYESARKKVDELLKGVKDEMEKISILTHWVADNIRYAGLTMGEGEGFTLHNLKMNYTDRCGVCKDIASTLISFLRMAGFEAYPAMTMAGSRIETIPADHFNHCVVVVRLSSGELMPLDPTWVPFSRELWSSAEQQQNYLPGIPEGSDLCITPISAPENHFFKLKVKTKLAANGTLTGTFTVKAEGLSDSRVRRPFMNGFIADWQNAMEKELMAISPKARLVKVSYPSNPRDYMAAPISITMQFEIPDYAVVGDGVLVMKPIIFSPLYSSSKFFLNANTSLEKRTTGFSIRCTQLLDLQEEITLPKGYTLINAPSDVEIVNPAAAITGAVSTKGRKVTVNNSLSFNKRVYEAADWEGFRSVVAGYHSLADESLIFKAN